MSLDLSALDQHILPSGRPLELRLSDIEEDPDQPRKVFTSEALARMADSIRRRGVRSPVSVRPHPTDAGRFMLNHGARRFRGSAMAGKETIPAVIDETHTDYDQVVENLQRDDLKPMELAEFIGRKLKSGDKKAFIARQLGIDASAVTQYLALIEPPNCIRETYASGRCQSPKTLYDLRMLYEAYPEEVDAWCKTSADITRRSVARLGERLKPDLAWHKAARAPDGVERSSCALAPIANTLDETGSVLGPHTEQISPQVWLEVGGRKGLLVLDRLPVDPSMVYLRFDGGPSDEAARAGDCRLVKLNLT